MPPPPLSNKPREKPASAVAKKLQNMIITPSSPVLLPRCPGWLRGYDTWRSKPDKVFTRRAISGGGRAEVHVATPRGAKDDKLSVVLKTFARDRLTANPRLLALVRNEWDIHSSLDHPNILAMLAGAEDKLHVTFALEHEQADLYEFINKSNKDYLTEAATRTVMCDLLNALIYMHDMGYVHRDVKSENIFLSRAGRWKLGDMGSTVIAPTPAAAPEAPAAGKKKSAAALAAAAAALPGGTDLVLSLEGTLAFAAPEYAALWMAREYDQLVLATTPKLDVWAAGAVAYDLLMGGPPFGVDGEDGTTEAQVVAAICRPRAEGELPLRVHPEDAEEAPPPALSEAGLDFLRVALVADPRRRPTALQLREHPWLAITAA